MKEHLSERKKIKMFKLCFLGSVFCGFGGDIAGQGFYFEKGLAI